jgi:hypothetical protein
MPASYVTPLQGLGWEGKSGPRALPWAGMSRPFRANFSIADPTDLLDPSDPTDPSVSRPCPVRVPSVFSPCPCQGF